VRPSDKSRLFHDVDVTAPEPSEAALAEPVVASEEVAGGDSANFFLHL